MFKSKRFYVGVAVTAVAVFLAGFALMATSAGQFTEVVTFDAAKLELPEGLIIDKSGNIYVGLGPPLGPVGEIRKIAPDGTQSIVVKLDEGPAPAGLAIDPKGTLYYALFTLDKSTRGVYRVERDGVPKRLPGSGEIILPNGLIFDKQGNLYVSDSIPGIVWRIPPGGAAEPWIQDDSLLGCGLDPNLPPVGANGLAYWHNHLYVASTEQGFIARVPVLPDGRAGELEVFAGDPDCDPTLEGLDSVDGIAMDVHGDIYALLVIQNKLVKVDNESGEFVELLDAGDGLHNPASIAFGTGKGMRQRVFFTNYALIQPGPDESVGPVILAYDTGVAGLPLP